MPAGFCETAGLTAEGPASAWVLTQREKRMFTALLQAEKSHGMMDVVTRPQLVALNEQTAFFQVSQQAEVVTGLKPEIKNGKTEYTAKVATVDVGVWLRLTPKINANGYMQLRIATETAELGGLVKVAAKAADGFTDVYAPATNKHSMETTVVLPVGGTVVVSGGLSSAGGKPATETLWMLTTHLVRNDKQPAAAPALPAIPPRALPSAAPVLPASTPPFPAQPAMPVMPYPQR